MTAHLAFTLMGFLALVFIGLTAICTIWHSRL